MRKNAIMSVSTFQNFLKVDLLVIGAVIALCASGLISTHAMAGIVMYLCLVPVFVNIFANRHQNHRQHSR